MYVTIVIIALFIVLGVCLYRGKGAFLIAGYNTLPKEKKEQFDEVALCKFMGKAMFGLSFSMVFWVLSEATQLEWLFIVGLILFMGIVFFIVIYSNTGNRFKRK